MVLLVASVILNVELKLIISILLLVPFSLMELAGNILGPTEEDGEM